ncbi:MAG: TIGR04283 family arsenosugar biosynthesis glycosyltransferase [Candidatus Thiodiazotropha sp. (ex Dulcina madagascariensis)]|nr:TIGR04283 family arsenosugar biosynthesis glycosyltransferase [Candidatus Thiodiazotropha sp. (ex Epidulcina cf. delphinae)]MCU7936367.1 TIGR04283 family arsenosugar biosynthesis glycosyltransferase [Candidatus Thiodiazotropha sp. (ex Dulcina madagascariensis)]
MPPRLSIVIPCLNEGELLEQCLGGLQFFRSQGHELVLVDGGSDASRVSHLPPYVDQFLVTSPGRARQMNLGALKACGDLLWFLHADTLVDRELEGVIAPLSQDGPVWGRFDIRLSGSHRMLRVVERMMNWRSRFSGIATGDQGIFVHRRLFDQVGGFPEQPLMEDIEISRRLKRIALPVCLRQHLVTSSRRWESRGILQTILLMWALRLGYWLGVSPERLAKLYNLESRQLTG